MTVSSMRCCRRRARLSKSLLLGAFLALSLALVNAFAAAPQGVDVRRPSITPVEDHLVLDAQFDIVLTPTLEEVLNKGVPLYFLLEFELIRPRWYWFNERVVYIQQEYRLSYN